jgi:NADPH:quinone reductase-like Zn-dependent oxidoreductase/acyl carrier protein
LTRDDIEALKQYDLILSADALHRLPDAIGLPLLYDALAPGGRLVFAESGKSLFRDIAFGLDPNWFATDGVGHPIGRLRQAAEWRTAAESAKFENVLSVPLHSAFPDTVLVVAERAADTESRIDTPLNPVLMTLHQTVPSQLAAGLVDAFAADGVGLQTVQNFETPPEISNVAIVLPPRNDPGEAQDALVQRCLELKRFADAFAGRKATLWLVFRNAYGSGAAAQPVEAGAWAFSRTLANEYPTLDIRRIDIASAVSDRVAARRIATVVQSAAVETELHLDVDGIRATRVQPLKSALRSIHQSEVAAFCLQRRIAAGQRVVWEETSRRRPEPTDVEIAVEATGLNFRDLMWSLGMLPEDMLEDGFTGPAFGLECAGRVVRVGASVTTLRPGDRVVALAASAFASHVNVPEQRVARIPENLATEAAATIPVAFLTAYYALVKLARLEPGETVLIHSGAGAVGMAAIQISKWRGARIIATAGSPAKRSLLSALGVDVVLDSRSMSFADEVRAVAGSGVDVVLNSLAGEAMEASIACLGPFGRFIELGKRDYVSNTHVGLRPFRRNLSYFGVDLDQFVVGRESAGTVLFNEVMALVKDGVLQPLPYSVFSGANIEEALHLMQQSSHVGKIVVRPVSARVERSAGTRWVAQAGGTHVITGAFGGFGMETARWLADRGARHLVLIGRRGADRPEAQALLADLRARGVRVLADPCDVSDLRAVEKLFEKIQKTMPPIVGVMHAAMVLDDAIIANLGEERFRRVLAPKVKGAEHLDLVTRGLKLDYFVLFSSVTTLIGNPGQGNYVAANAFMEGLARRRRQSGLPALAIGWGPIADVGVVAESEKLRNSLQKLIGVKGMRAREALELLGQALVLPDTAAELAVMTISPNDGGFSKERLPVLRSPTYQAFVSDRETAETSADRIDLRALLEAEPIETVRRKVSDIVTRQLANVLHARVEDISRVRPLGEIGLDSLMTLELVMDLESAFGFSISLVNSVGVLTVPALADEIIAQAGLDQDRDQVAVADLAGRHVATLTPEHVEALKTVVADDTRPSRERAL